MTDPELGVDIISLKRKGKWIFKIRDTLKLQVRDTIIATGFNERVEAFEELATGPKQKEEE